MVLTGETEEHAATLSQYHFVDHKSHMDFPAKLNYI